MIAQEEREAETKVVAAEKERARRGWSVTTDLRVESSYVEDGRLHVLVGLNEGAAGEVGLRKGEGREAGA